MSIFGQDVIKDMTSSILNDRASKANIPLQAAWSKKHKLALKPGLVGQYTERAYAIRQKIIIYKF